MNRNIKHPAPFPVNLVKDLIYSWSNEDYLVLDPFMGSGSTAVACKKTNRNIIGIEKELEYFNIAKQRILTAEEPIEVDLVASMFEDW